MTPNSIIDHPKGSIYHGMKTTDLGYSGFGEAYFSSVLKDVVKGWKKHSSMTLNLLVPEGKIQIVVYNEVSFFSTVLSCENYQRLTVKPNLWVAFKGLSKRNLLLNIANQLHDPNESETLLITDIEYSGWKACE